MSRELDREIAEKVMGWKKDGRFDWVSNERGFESRISSFQPSQDISAAFLVVEKMRELGFLMLTLGQHIDNTWRCKFTNANTFEDFSFISKTAPDAICRAALLAVADS